DRQPAWQMSGNRVRLLRRLEASGRRPAGLGVVTLVEFASADKAACAVNLARRHTLAGVRPLSPWHDLVIDQARLAAVLAFEQAGDLLHRALLLQDKQKEHEGCHALMLCLAVSRLLRWWMERRARRAAEGARQPKEAVDAYEKPPLRHRAQPRAHSS